MSPHRSTRVQNGGRANCPDYCCGWRGLTIAGSDRVSLAVPSRRGNCRLRSQRRGRTGEGDSAMGILQSLRRSRVGGTQPGSSTEVAQFSRVNEAVTVV